MAFATAWRGVLLKIERRLPAKLLPIWNHPAGLKTIHFWAPAFKWGLVIAAIADIARPPEKLSARQSGSLAVTGFIWARYALVIIPKNWNLFGVNLFVGLTGTMQLTRIYLHQQSLKNQAAEVEATEEQKSLPATEATPSQ
ncbi:mitochondrial pyruvate carrier 2-like [Ptychodera flava]|uniref:mitochondrial pyruvate carrier 2-like n=1 Tax=Ptychodera flava TaxID=63121 RepID=UPI00396A5175